MTKEPDFSPEDPTAGLWRKILPKGRPSRPQSAEERLKKSKASKAYYAEHDHHSKGVMGTARPVLSDCKNCDKGIRDEHLVKLGLCKACLRYAVETGHIVVRNGEYVLVKKLKRKKRG